jgi:hypothetical protein
MSTRLNERLDERSRLVDLLIDARCAFRDTRKGGAWEGDRKMISYAEKCHREYKAGRVALNLRERYCWGEMALVDDCYGMTGGRKYACQTCESYVVTRDPDNNPSNCVVPRVAGARQ